MIVLKNLECYTPKYIGKRDILISYDKIFRIEPEIEVKDNTLITEVYQCDGLLAFPGLIDQHVHITGGGGEEGFTSHVAEIKSEHILQTGVTTVVGLLGTDNTTRSMEALYAKAKALELEGISTYIYSGSYSIPPVTITGSIVRDLVFIDKVIGIGEIAISDHRSSHASIDQLLKIASEAHLGGLLGNKAGIFHMHLGDGKKGLTPVIDMVKESDLPIEVFVPTHINRNKKLLTQGLEYVRQGGHIDLTAGETEGISVPESVRLLKEGGLNLSNITISSDANASMPGGGTSKINTIYEDIIKCITDATLIPETAFSLATENVAKLLKVFPKKGTIREGSDADLVVLDKEYHINKVFCLGKLMFNNK